MASVFGALLLSKAIDTLVEFLENSTVARESIAQLRLPEMLLYFILKP